jgi:hypothetical protein
MEGLIEPLLKLIVGSLEHSELVAKVLDGFAGKIQNYFPLPELVEQLLRHPESIFAFVVATILAASMIALVIGAHALEKAIVKRRGRVFISYQREREPIADQIALQLRAAKIVVRKLDFVENVDHDELLDQVKEGIRHADVLICVPGISQSFVESEVSMAFGLERMMIFALDSSVASYLPDTAKKGYPVFDLQRLQPNGFLVLASFCAYLAGDLRATMRLYGAVGRHVGKCVSLVLIVCFVSIILMATIERKLGMFGLTSTVAGVRVQVDGFTIALIAACVTAFLMTAVLFFASRFLYRTKLKRAILRRRFSESFIPGVLDLSLSRADLLRVLYSGQVIPHHEAPTGAAASVEHK